MSYGGYFSFVVSHEASSDGETLYAPDIILIVSSSNKYYGVIYLFNKS